MNDRELRQAMFIRVCRDSKFTMDPVKAAQLAAQIVKCHPLEIWIALGWDNMERIARNDHPAIAKLLGA